jgi:phospho-N-acetylmuramoyl-pentapeptide-transferase
VKGVLVAAAASLVLSLLGTPWFIRWLVKRQYGQFIRDDGPTSHRTKRGTPTMGGTVIVGATLAAYALAHLAMGRWPTASGVLVLFLMTGMATVGFLDDYIKISRQRSLGLRTKQKLLGQGLVGVTFAVLALQFESDFRTPASTAISFVRDTRIDLAFAGPVVGVILFVLWANFIITAISNGANLTDGLDGLATGASVMIFGAYLLIGIWTNNQNCQTTPGPKCYEVRDSLDLAIVAAAAMGACFGFLWWNASPAKIFMGDTGSLGLGGAIAGLTCGWLAGGGRHPARDRGRVARLPAPAWGRLRKREAGAVMDRASGELPARQVPGCGAAGGLGGGSSPGSPGPGSQCCPKGQTRPACRITRRGRSVDWGEVARIAREPWLRGVGTIAKGWSALHAGLAVRRSVELELGGHNRGRPNRQVAIRPTPRL